MLNVACVKVGERYDAHYVNVLFDMVRRNLPAGFEGRFICFTDDATGLDPLIETREVPSDLASRGWWAKLWLFNEGAFPAGERVLYFDLDTVVCGPLDALATYQGDFAILRDAYRSEGLQSSVMAWKAGACNYIYRCWFLAGCPDVDGGDQAWIEKFVKNPDILQEKFPGRLRSYKVECRSEIPRGTSVVFFHGYPRPHEVESGWVPEVWKIGGGSGIEWIVQANVELDALRANVKSAISRDCAWVNQHPENKGHAIIVGGGPSLKKTMFYIRGMQMAGGKVFATNNTYKHLLAHGITPDAHVMLDARPENAEFVPDDLSPKYYASQCHPSVLEAAGPSLVCWHAHQAGYTDIVLSHPSGAIEIGGGTTVGLKAVALAYLMGYRDIRLFGFDSCYEDDAHHAYAQPLNDGQRIVDVTVGGQKFRAAPWMVAQAEEFKDTVTALVHLKCVVTVYGEGLLPKVAEEMGKRIREVNGMYWPASDVETRSSVIATLGDLHQYVELCAQKKVAVQAGGNVGVWPKELSKHFERVYTFEPDPINWECFQKNVHEPNVIAKQAALGSKPGFIAIEHDAFNCGASRVCDGADIPVVTIDALNLPACDLLQLDVEGYEFEALKGAERTIKQHSPVIVLEQKGLGDRYGATDEETTEWLKNLGYKRVHAIHRDVVYMRVN